MAIRITEDGVVNYENSPDVNRKLFPNLNICGKEIDELAKEIDGKAPAVFSASSGSIASFDNGADDMPLKSCVVSFEPIQEGEGDPTPESVRPIRGRTGLTVSHSGADTSDPTTISVNWETETGTVYGGYVDVVSGKLTVDYFKYSPLSSYTPSQYISLGTYTRVAYSGAAVKPGVNASVPYTGVYSHGSYDNRAWTGDYSHAFCTDTRVGYFYLPCEATTDAIQAYLKSQEDAGTPVTVAYKIATPIEYQLIPQEVRTLLGENNIWSEDGDISVEYPVDTKTYIDDLSIKTVEVSGQTPTITAEENTRYICGEVTSLSFTPCEKGICDVRFTAASISTVLTLPETVKLPEWFDPTLLEAGTTYEINVLDGVYGVVMSWA